jgi:hypothetical protein
MAIIGLCFGMQNAQGATTTIDVLVVYTAEARGAAGGTDGILSKIDAAIAQGNTSFDNSMAGMAAEAGLRLVHTEEITYTETGNLETEVERLQSTSDGYMDSVHALRDQYGADLVILLTGRTDTENYAGMGYLMNNVSSGFNAWAFSVTRQDYATRHTFIHEIGHNLGCHHDPDNATGSGAYDYSYGHRFDANELRYRTVMAYDPGTRISYFSSPDITVGGIATGIADERDNARTIFNTMETAAAFRDAVHGDVDLKATALDNRVMLRWNQPLTVGYGSDLVHLRFSTDTYPATTNGGSFAYQGTNHFFLHTNVTSGVTHFYSIWLSDDGSTFIEP